MIRIEYENDQTGQHMIITLTLSGGDSVEAEIKFTPDISDATQDPYGIMGKLLNVLPVPKETP